MSPLENTTPSPPTHWIIFSLIGKPGISLLNAILWWRRRVLQEKSVQHHIRKPSPGPYDYTAQPHSHFASAIFDDTESENSFYFFFFSAQIWITMSASVSFCLSAGLQRGRFLLHTSLKWNSSHCCLESREDRLVQHISLSQGSHTVLMLAFYSPCVCSWYNSLRQSTAF